MIRRLIYPWLVLLMGTSLLAGDYIHHELEVRVDPQQNSLQVVDGLRIPGLSAKKEIYFLLHGDLKISKGDNNPGIRVEKTDRDITAALFGLDAKNFQLPADIPYQAYKITVTAGAGDNLTLAYEGKINHPVQQLNKEYARGFSETPGVIDSGGVYLAGSSLWLPWFNEELISFNMNVTMEENWRAVSQGKEVRTEGASAGQIRWESPEPMDEVFLIAARFSEYRKQIGNVAVIAYLRTADPGLAAKYLETTAQYLEMYNQLIGQYPYSKFALIENFWETGYGMPSFTLLGEKVIRFPFILHSSYPHELLHNWWGNSVFVDYESGNWCEGLTAFMADHLIKEQRGQGEEYRRSALQAFTDYVNEDNDFPLTDFHSRTDAASSAIGYNKSMMMFNMLRQEVGDDIFRRAIQKFYRANKFKRAGYKDIQNAVEEISGKDFKSFFEQWVQRKGAPSLAVRNARGSQQADGYHLAFDLEQVQDEAVYQINVPVAITLEGEKSARVEMVLMDNRKQNYNLVFQSRPLLIDIDPQFDVLRRLDRNEIPPALSQIFGSERVSIVLPTQGDKTLIKGYADLARTWAESDSEKIAIINDTDLSDVPLDQSLWIFGKENRWKSLVVAGLKDYDTEITPTMYRIGKSQAAPDKNSIILTVRHPENPEQVLVWLTSDNAAAFPGLGRKLPHYGKYSYLAFEGEEPTNILKGQWAAVNSPMSAVVSWSDTVPGVVERAALSQREALATLAPVFSEERLAAHVNYLAGEDLAGRGLGTAGLDKAADYIAEQFASAGLKPAGDGEAYFQTWQESGGKENRMMTLKNVIGIIPGTNAAWKDQSVVICAHYDHLGLGWPDVISGNEGKIHFGADDNASGVAVMLELAALLGKDFKPARTLVFVALTGEESGLRGSKHYVSEMKTFPADKTMGAINLDTVGRLGKNKIHILSASSASEWKHIAMGIGFVTGLEYELVTQDLDASDQVSFIKAGMPAIQLFSGPNRDYHKPTDTAEKIDLAGMVKIATFTREAAVYLTEREEPMRFSGPKESSSHPGGKPQEGGRKVGTGVMPDFAFQGEGVKVGEVAEGSPAAKAGISKGDVIIQLGDQKVTDLRSYSNLLKSYQPGDTADIVFIHDGKEIKSRITLQAR